MLATVLLRLAALALMPNIEKGMAWAGRRLARHFSVSSAYKLYYDEPMTIVWSGWEVIWGT